MRVIRVLGWLWIALAAVALAIDVVQWSPGEYRLSALGELWARLHRNSLLLLEPAIDRHIWPGLWQGAIVPILLLPAVAVLALPGVILLALAKLGGARHKARRRGGLRDG